VRRVRDFSHRGKRGNRRLSAPKKTLLKRRKEQLFDTLTDTPRGVCGQKGTKDELANSDREGKTPNAECWKAEEENLSREKRGVKPPRARGKKRDEKN